MQNKLTAVKAKIAALAALDSLSDEQARELEGHMAEAKSLQLQIDARALMAADEAKRLDEIKARAVADYKKSLGADNDPGFSKDIIVPWISRKKFICGLPGEHDPDVIFGRQSGCQIHGNGHLHLEETALFHVSNNLRQYSLDHLLLDDRHLQFQAKIVGHCPRGNNIPGLLCACAVADDIFPFPLQEF